MTSFGVAEIRKKKCGFPQFYQIGNVISVIFFCFVIASEIQWSEAILFLERKITSFRRASFVMTVVMSLRMKYDVVK